MPTVARLNVTPVKSTALEHPEDIVVTERGVQGDRRFLFVDEYGKRLSEAGKAPLLGIRTSYDGSDRLSAEFGDGERVEEEVSSDGGDLLDVALYDRAVKGRVVGAQVAEAVSAWVGRSLRLVRVDEPEYAGGRHRISLISIASVRDLGRRGGLDGDGPDPRRFRMTVELDGCEPYEEDSWVGRRVRLGEAVVRVGDGIPRCVLTTMHPDTGEKDFPTLEVLALYRRRDGELPFGVYADVVQPGRISVGDAVEPL